MFGISAAAVAAIGAAAVTSASAVYASRQQSKATMQAAAMQKKASDEALSQQTQEMRRNNQMDADTESILESNVGSDTQSTMLTGPNGLTLDDLILGRGTSLLGGRQ